MQYKEVPFSQKDFLFRIRALEILSETNESIKSDLNNFELDKIISMYNIPELNELGYTSDEIRKIFKRGIIDSLLMLVKVTDYSKGKAIALKQIDPHKLLPSFHDDGNPPFSKVWKDMDGNVMYYDDELILIDLGFRHNYLISKLEKMMELCIIPKLSTDYLNSLERESKIENLLK